MRAGRINRRRCLLAALYLAFLVPGPGCARREAASSFKAVFDRYRAREGVVAVSFPPGLLGIFLDEDDPDQAELKKLFSGLSSFRMLSVPHESENPDLPDELKAAVMEYSGGRAFADVFRMQAEGEDLFIRARENDGSIREAILMFGAGESFFVVDLRGNIDPAQLNAFAQGGGLKSFSGLADLRP
jgi:hypothetical protein